MLKNLIDSMIFDDTQEMDNDDDDSAMGPIEASTLAIIILCLLSSTSSIRVIMVEQGK